MSLDRVANYAGDVSSGLGNCGLFRRAESFASGGAGNPVDFHAMLHVLGVVPIIGPVNSVADAAQFRRRADLCHDRGVENLQCRAASLTN